VKYIYEDAESLIERIIKYSREIKKNGILSQEQIIKDEPNQFLKTILTELCEGVSEDSLKSYKRFIKYYVEELNCSNKKKEKIAKQLKMVLYGVKMIDNGESYHQIENELLKFYPKGFIQVGDFIRATKDDEMIFYGKVTALEDDLVFFTQLNTNEELVVFKEQITDNYKNSKKVKLLISSIANDKLF